MAGRAAAVGKAGTRALVLAAVSLAGSLTLLVATLVSLLLVPLGVGVLTTPLVLTGVRMFADRRRLLVLRWGGPPIPREYRPPTAGAGPWRRLRDLLGDPATRRDLRWLVVDMTAGFVTALLPAALLFYPLEGFALAAGLWRVFTDGTHTGYWYAFVPVSGQASALTAARLGLVFWVVAWFLTPALLSAHLRLTRAALAGRQGELAERVRVLTETRRAAVD
ncbi:sensor domain-containing protein, partial [Streptomyces carpinensis]